VPDCDGVRFTSLVKAGFSQRRKQLRKMLVNETNSRGTEPIDWPALCAHLGVEETCRGEELSLEQWIALTNFVTGDKPAEASNAQDVHGEIFDVVDENDVVVGQKSRFEVHRQKMLHRAVHVFVFNQHGEVFLQRRSKWKDKHPLRWDSSAAGHVNAGQTYDETAPREVEEELGVTAEVESHWVLPPSVNTGFEHVRIYRAKHDGPFRLNRAELDGGGFFTMEQVDRWTAARPEDFAPGFLECWKCYRASPLPEG
jgi:16S rRNA (adenine1518-N6/adenine1519-N6)-dimethyltransferase